MTLEDFVALRSSLLYKTMSVAIDDAISCGRQHERRRIEKMIREYDTAWGNDTSYGGPDPVRQTCSFILRKLADDAA